MDMKESAVILKILSSQSACYIVYFVYPNLNHDYGDTKKHNEVIVFGEEALLDEFVHGIQKIFPHDIDIARIRQLCNSDKNEIPHGLIWEFHNNCISQMAMRNVFPHEIDNLSIYCASEMVSAWNSIMRENLPRWLENKTSNQDVVNCAENISWSTLVNPSPELVDYLCVSCEWIEILLMLRHRNIEAIQPYCLVPASVE